MPIEVAGCRMKCEFGPIIVIETGPQWSRFFTALEGDDLRKVVDFLIETTLDGVV